MTHGKIILGTAGVHCTIFSEAFLRNSLYFWQPMYSQQGRRGDIIYILGSNLKNRSSPEAAIGSPSVNHKVHCSIRHFEVANYPNTTLRPLKVFGAFSKINRT